MKTIQKFLFYLAATGFTLGLIVHFLSIADIIVTNKVPFVWVLHLGIFMVFVPALFFFKRNVILQTNQQSGIQNRIPSLRFYHTIYKRKRIPNWLVITAITAFFYGIINFMLFMYNSRLGTPDFFEGQYILHKHGQLVKILTEQEYHHYKANEIRGFSGLWLVFYSISATLLFPFNPPKKKIT